MDVGALFQFRRTVNRLDVRRHCSFNFAGQNSAGTLAGKLPRGIEHIDLVAPAALGDRGDRHRGCPDHIHGNHGAARSILLSTFDKSIDNEGLSHLGPLWVVAPDSAWNRSTISLSGIRRRWLLPASA